MQQDVDSYNIFQRRIKMRKSYWLWFSASVMVALILLRLAFDAPETGMADGLQNMIQERLESSFKELFKIEGQDSLDVESIQWK